MLIALSGYARSGKDSVGSILEGKGFERTAFANKLRGFALALDPLVETDPEHHVGFAYRERLRFLVDAVGWEEAKKSRDVRELLQRLGTEAGRDILGENVWIDAALNGLDEERDYVVTDCRFKNEAEAVRERGGLVWRINRPGFGPCNNHASEIDLDGYGFDWMIYNDGTLDDLTEKIEGALVQMAEAGDLAPV